MDTEKIIESFIAGTIPTYYGDYMIDEYINPKAYILIKGEKDINNKIEYIKKIDNDNELYRTLLNEKLFLNKSIIEKANEELLNFFINFFEHNKNLAKRIDNENRNLNCTL